MAEGPGEQDCFFSLDGRDDLFCPVNQSDTNQSLLYAKQGSLYYLLSVFSCPVMWHEQDAVAGFTGVIGESSASG